MKAGLISIFVFLAIVSTGRAEILNGIVIAPELDGSSYNRKTDFGDWKDADGDGQDTRQEVLAAESLVPVTWSADGKKVVAGLWYDPFAGMTFTAPLVVKPSGRKYAIVQIDHIVPLKEAFESGAKNWTKAKRVLYANGLANPGHLLAVHGPTNASKGQKDPGEWLPPNKKFHCAYVRMWTRIKIKWDLTMDQAEADAIRAELGTCG